MALPELTGTASIIIHGYRNYPNVASLLAELLAKLKLGLLLDHKLDILQEYPTDMVLMMSELF